MQQVPSFAPINRQRGNTEKRSGPDTHQPRTFTEDLKSDFRGGETARTRKDIRPTHKRTLSDTSPRYHPSSSTFDQLYSPQHSTLSRERPSSPTTDEEMSESEQMIWTIIKQRVSQTDFVVEEREEDEESDSDSTPRKEPLSKLQYVLENFLQQKAEEQQTEGQRRKEIRSQLLALLTHTQDEEKLSQCQTPQMSVLLSEALRSSCNSNATITGPGGSFHLPDVFSSSSSPRRSSESRLNSSVIQQALECVCLPGELCRKQREEALSSLFAVGKGQHVVILLSNSFPRNQFSGLYVVEGSTLRRFYGGIFDEQELDEALIEAFFTYDVAAGDFSESCNLEGSDAVRLKSFCRLP